jgi:hypothetical protein
MDLYGVVFGIFFILIEIYPRGYCLRITYLANSLKLDFVVSTIKLTNRIIDDKHTFLQKIEVKVKQITSKLNSEEEPCYQITAKGKQRYCLIMFILLDVF